jgi:hypothetical protein
MATSALHLPRPGDATFLPLLCGLGALAGCSLMIASYTRLSSPAAPAETPSETAKPQTVSASVTPTDAAPAAPPTAAEFGRILTGTANAYAEAHGEETRVGRARCAQGAPGHYLCAYTTTESGGRPVCRVVQARWTPQRLSTFTVELSGVAARCGTLRQAVQTLRE